MRCGLFLIILALGADAVFSQIAVENQNSGLAVIKYSWSKERLYWDNSELDSANTGTYRSRIRPPKAIREKDANAQRSTQITTSARKPVEDPRFRFTYNVVVRNESAKKILEIDWDYLFFDVATSEEIGRRQFTSVEKIDAGKTKKLSIQVPSPPVNRIDAQQTSKNEREGISERVVVLRILYQDNSEWRASSQ